MIPTLELLIILLRAIAVAYSFLVQPLQAFKSSTLRWVEAHSDCPIRKLENRGESACDAKRLANAISLKAIHDQIERVAYQALVDGVVLQKIDSDSITPDQCGYLLRTIKAAAHAEMFKEGGYMKRRTSLLHADQLQQLMQRVGHIIHDRDSKLTNACYNSLTLLIMALDDHNTMVKEILIESWAQSSISVSDVNQSHVNSIQTSINFYQQLAQHSESLKNLSKSVHSSKLYWDHHFPGMRRDPTAGSIFFNVVATRRASQHLLPVLRSASPTAPLFYFLNEVDVLSLFHARPPVKNFVRNCSQHQEALIDDMSITIGSFCHKYFPEVQHNITQRTPHAKKT